MAGDDDEVIKKRFKVILDLFDTGVAMMRQNLRREHPHASEAEIRALLTQWLHSRPGAEEGDAEGRPRRSVG